MMVVGRGHAADQKGTIAMNNDGLQALLNFAAQKLGTNASDLQQQAQNGDFSGLLGNMNPNDAAKLQQVLSDKNATQKLMSTPEAQELLRKLNGNKG